MGAKARALPAAHLIVAVTHLAECEARRRALLLQVGWRQHLEPVGAASAASAASASTASLPAAALALASSAACAACNSRASTYA